MCENGFAYVCVVFSLCSCFFGGGVVLSLDCFSLGFFVIFFVLFVLYCIIKGLWYNKLLMY